MPLTTEQPQGILSQPSGQGGLLSFISSPAGQGLLSAAFSGLATAGRPGVGRWNALGTAGLSGLQGYSGAQENQRQAAFDEQRKSLMSAQLTGLNTQNDTGQFDLSQRRKRQAYWENMVSPQSSGQPQPPLPSGGPMGTSTANGPIQSPSAPGESMPAPMGTNGTQFPQINPAELLRNGFSIEDARSLSDINTWNLPKAVRWERVPTADGKGVELVGIDANGRRVDTGVRPFVEPAWQDRGGSFVAVNPVSMEDMRSVRKTMTPDGIAADRRARENQQWQRENGSGVVVQTDQGPVVVNQRTGAGTPVTGPDGQTFSRPLAPVPASANTAMTENSKALTNIDDAIAEVTRSTGYTIDASGNVTRVKGAKPTAPDALGGWNYLPDAVRQRTDSEGVPLRAKLANIATGKYHDISGAAVTASEAERLRPFVPAPTDTPEVALKKLYNMRREYQGVNDSLSSTYSREQGYRANPAKPQRPPLASFDKSGNGQRPPLSTFEGN